MNYRITYSDVALKELDEAYQWIASQAPENAVRWYNGLGRAIDTLEVFPRRCGLAPESKTFGTEIRQFIYGQYWVLFEVREREVMVLHIRHGGRLPMEPQGNKG